MIYILLNRLSKNGNNNDILNKIEAKYQESSMILDVIELGEKYKETLNNLTEDDRLILIGGDGTLNHFVNELGDDELKCPAYFAAAGTGNDFLNDVKDIVDADGFVNINDCVKNLPKVKVNGKVYRFINGVGFGIDGYCCEEGDRLQKKSTKPVNYTAVAIKGLLFKYKAPNATITIDGVTKEYKKVWLAPAMKGRFYGGGMMVAPNQNRYDEDRYITNVVFHKSGKLKTLMIFPNIFKGTHIEHTKYCTETKGKNIKVVFSCPQALQIDGETISNVTEYEAWID